MAAPAMTSVATRRSFNPPPSNSPNTPRQQKVDWPDPVRAFVQRSFADENAIKGVTGDEMKARLKDIINGAAQSGALHNIDWSSHELPQQTILRERQRRSTAPTSEKHDQIMSTLQLNDASHSTDSQGGKKRKSTEAELDRQDPEDRAQSLPWRTGNPVNVFESRVTYQSPAQAKKIGKRQRKANDETSLFTDTSKSINDLEKRRMRFEDSNARTGHAYSSQRERSPTPFAPGRPVMGTSQDLEKRYFRLTAPPKPDTVRPLSILRRTLDHLKKKWRHENDYGYICDQFKSMRQDLTVQHIKNDFTVNVYEIHARIALEKGDLGEYNQCQTQLRALYKQNLGGHPGEFMAYRILYFIYTCNRTDMNAALADLTQADHKEPAVKHALQARSALALGNYHRFFRLYLTTPNMGAYLMDMFIGRERLAAMAQICRLYKPDVPLQFLTEELAFDENEQCCSFLCDHGGEHLFERREDGRIDFATSKASNVFDVAKAAAFRSVDIKGQI
ncbi:MAG: hypothetical protein M1828_005983 [Chrysothrix sp. TS-e1954]|nr:MAG: hypothetical protein M1828_005983 [Chrysothrix sp. TS-e1954]